MLNSINHVLSNTDMVNLKSNFKNLKTNRINSDYYHNNRGNFYLSEESLYFAVEFTNIIQKISL
jgi:hypothetical protein